MGGDLRVQSLAAFWGEAFRPGCDPITGRCTVWPRSPRTAYARPSRPGSSPPPRRPRLSRRRPGRREQADEHEHEHDTDGSEQEHP